MSEWKEYRLSDIAEIHDSKRIPLNSRDRSSMKGNSPYYGASGIVDYINDYIFYGEYVLISEDGENLRSRQTPIAFKVNGKFWVNNHAHILKGRDELINDFIVYYFRNLNISPYITGAVQPKLNMYNLLSIPIFMPENRAERVSITRTLLSLDNKIHLLRRQNETLEAIAQTLFKRWFVEFEFPDENGRPYKSSGGKMVSSELGKIPKGWNISKLVKEIQIIGGGTPSTKEPSYWGNGTINWYTPSDLTSNNELYSLGSGRKITEKGLSNSSATLFPEYSLLMTSRATIGEIAINTNKACTNQGFIILIPNDSYPVYFLHSWLLGQLNIIRRLASGSTFPEINRSEFKNFDILKIPIETMNVYKKIVTPIYRKIENNIRESKSLKITRDTLLPKL
ncbi:MAG: restriction endonuclease subunit S, partial [Candidatus Marinimicrobia bacterium]|nr:restriction endonuclease subunit S [Candidatus Neomarinimicrobiota bacterium]